MVVGCQPYAPAAFTPRKYSWYSFLLEAESTPGPQCDRKDFMSIKNPLTPAWIEPATFRFVAQHLSHCAVSRSYYFKRHSFQITVASLISNAVSGGRHNIANVDGTIRISKPGVSTRFFLSTHSSRAVQRPAQPPIQRIQGLFRRFYIGWGVALNTHPAP